MEIRMNPLQNLSVQVMQKQNASKSVSAAPDASKIEQMKYEGGKFDVLTLDAVADPNYVHVRKDVAEGISVPSNVVETVRTKAFKNWENHLTNTIRETKEKGLGFSESSIYIHKKSIDFMENLRQNEPEQFREMLIFNRFHIEAGKSDLACLPPDFTMEDYYRYVGDET